MSKNAWVCKKFIKLRKIYMLSTEFYGHSLEEKIRSSQPTNDAKINFSFIFYFSKFIHFYMLY